MERWERYDKIQIGNRYVIDKIVYEKNEVDVILGDGTINGNKEVRITIKFKNVKSYKYSDEHGMIKRFSKIPVDILRANRFFRVINETDEITTEHYLIADEVDSAVEIFSDTEPDILLQ